jgi:hypothetical protein
LSLKKKKGAVRSTGASPQKRQATTDGLLSVPTSSPAKNGPTRTVRLSLEDEAEQNGRTRRPNRDSHDFKRMASHGLGDSQRGEGAFCTQAKNSGRRQIRNPVETPTAGRILMGLPGAKEIVEPAASPNFVHGTPDYPDDGNVEPDETDSDDEQATQPIRTAVMSFLNIHYYNPHLYYSNADNV